jgi:hypothetical protein
MYHDGVQSNLKSMSGDPEESGPQGGGKQEKKLTIFLVTSHVDDGVVGLPVSYTGTATEINVERERLEREKNSQGEGYTVRIRDKEGF